MRRILTLLLFTTICSGAQGQRLNPGDYIYPIRGVAGLYSANFGEMRPGHFHGGIDIKTDGGEGKPLVAVADGYVSRVSVSPSGYGRAIYLTLGNGTTAVYGHLQRFRGDIEKHVRDERFRRRANSIDLWFGPGAWPVAQGDTIGFSGNSGSSLGPHLHFELRDTPTQRLYNVVREGVVRPDDDLPPRIMRIHYIEVDSVQGVPVHGRPESYSVVREAEGRYRLTREEPVGTGRKGYFVLEASDRRNGVHNTFGLWRASMSVDGDLTARIPAGAVYEPIFCHPEQRQAPASDSTAAVLSPAYRILDAETPLRRPMTVSVHAFVPDDMQSRTVLATRTAKGRIACIGGRYADGAVTATTRTTGDIFVAADTIPPRIRPLFSEGADLGGARSIRFRVSDNFSGIASCTLLIDGRWAPCDRFPMQGTLVHAFDRPAAKKRRSVQLSVTDGCGNTARWEGTFWR